MALRQSFQFQLRLIACHVAGVLGEFATMPQLLALGLDMQNVVLSWILGVVLFLILATLGGLIWWRSIMNHPVRWAIAAPAVLLLTIYLLLRSLTGFEPADAGLARETSFVAGLCALFSSVFFLIWTSMVSGRASRS